MEDDNLQNNKVYTTEIVQKSRNQWSRGLASSPASWMDKEELDSIADWWTEFPKKFLEGITLRKLKITQYPWYWLPVQQKNANKNIIVRDLISFEKTRDKCMKKQ